MNAKCYYQVLGLKSNATKEEIKKAYKVLAIKVHSDKNKAPNADEAFKKLNAANTCLSDPVKKREYD